MVAATIPARGRQFERTFPVPTLDWIGKRAVENHHHQVPFHLLKDVPELSVGDPGTGNLIVEGDNLIALKALLPYYAGQVKCIYIDPPYNTGNEGWVYCLTISINRVMVMIKSRKDNLNRSREDREGVLFCRRRRLKKTLLGELCDFCANSPSLY
jgi:hypothetical protein